MSDIQRRYSPDWPGVVSLMHDWATQNSDDFLGMIAGRFGQLVESHHRAGEGCGSCNGETQYCGPWSDAQDAMLAWLISKVDI